MSYFRRVKLEDKNDVLYDVQHPLSTDGDSLYLKDLDLGLCTYTGWLE